MAFGSRFEFNIREYFITSLNKYKFLLNKDNSPLHEIQRDPNFDQMVDKMMPKVTKEKPSRKNRDGGSGGGANGSGSGVGGSDEQNCRG